MSIEDIKKLIKCDLQDDPDGFYEVMIVSVDGETVFEHYDNLYECPEDATWEGTVSGAT